MNMFERQAVAFKNDMKRSCAALIGIAQGVLADGHLNDREITFLRDWLVQNENMSADWPGNAMFAKVEAALADGIISPDERRHLTETLQKLVGGALEDLASSTHVCELALDTVEMVTFESRSFCFTGDFFFGPRDACAEHTRRRGGEVAAGVSRKLHYLVVGGLGSAEWKHGSFGTKVEKAIALRSAGAPLLITHEDAWAAALASRC